MKGSKHFIFLLAPALLLAGCFGGGSSSSGGGGSSSDSLTSQFIDDPVVGLNYLGKDGSSGVTGVNGSFSCKSGEIVIFKLGSNIDLGEAVCGEKVFLQNLSSKDHASKIGALLQSFGVAGGQIVIPTSVRQQTLPSITVSTLNDGAITGFFNDPALSSLSITPVTVADAATNIQSSLNTYLQLPSALSDALDTLSDSRTSVYDINMDPANPNYSPSDARIEFINPCPDVGQMGFSFGVYKNSGLYYAEMYEPAGTGVDEDGPYTDNHRSFGDSLISGETFGIGGSSTCTEDDGNGGQTSIACSFSLTGKINPESKNLVGTFSVEVPSQNVKCSVKVNKALNF